MPGIDCAYLAMDTEEGVEVVWNEVQFSERKNFKAQEEKIQQVFENLTQLEHPNIVKFHRYWTDTHNDKPRVSIHWPLSLSLFFFMGKFHRVENPESVAFFEIGRHRKENTHKRSCAFARDKRFRMFYPI